MNLLVFGASRGVGLEVVRQALAQGHRVTAFARTIADLPKDPNLRAVQGDALNPGEVRQAVAGHDAVVGALGGGNMPQSTSRSVGTANIVAAMESEGVKRLIIVSSFGVGDSRKGLVAQAAWLFLKAALEEHERQEKAVIGSSLDWTIVRPTGLTNDAKSGTYKVGSHGRGRIPRADVADFILKQLVSEEYLHKAVVIST